MYSIIQYDTMYALNVCAPKCKNPYLGWGPFRARSNFLPVQSHVVVQLLHFLQAVGPTHLLIPPSTHMHTCDKNSKLAEEDIVTLESFFV